MVKIRAVSRGGSREKRCETNAKITYSFVGFDPLANSRNGRTIARLEVKKSLGNKSDSSHFDDEVGVAK